MADRAVRRVHRSAARNCLGSEDETGNRRFRPVRVGVIDIDALRRDVERLWAEAVTAYRNGESWWLDLPLEAKAAEEQHARRVEDAWEARILEWCISRQSVGVNEILDRCLQLPIAQQDPQSMSRVKAVLKVNGWRQVRRRDTDGKRPRTYERSRPWTTAGTTSGTTTGGRPRSQ